ncbi:J domain-containing protein [Natronorubrum thiooxidans]|uniref:DnaJ domain-containing protein n=1 Tax=Natronorubrum thiooxidans TaxID=308853 RepID=A0A1N7H795_9EURY|nr:DnaJ domain-containing protein [Natronorubrum thiooxidans]SIS20745.1 DnaJ domain-containing protein [Natronorubrum thiooxidans]
MTDTYYDRLRISPDADQSDIQQAWQEIVKEKHPDHNDDPNAQQQFIQIKEAYDVLSDPEKRERYDRLGHGQYIDDRQHGSSDETQDAYQRDRTKQKQRRQTAGSNPGTDSGVNWQANTRGHDAAEHVWKPGAGPTANTAPPTNTADAEFIERVVAYGACVSIPAFFSMFMIGAWLEGGMSFNNIVITAATAAVCWATIVGSEWLLDTNRRIWTPF